MRLALIDDDVSLLDYLKQELESTEQVEIVFTATNGVECMRWLEIIQPTHYPHLILMDISMPKLDGIEATKQITEKYAAIQVVMLTTFEDDEKILACIQAGAKGYLLKGEKTPFILQTLEEVMQGGSQMSTSIARNVFRLLQSTPIKNTEPMLAIELLTPREREVLELLRQAYKYKKIAETLNIEENTVKKHIRNIYEKLGIKGKWEVIKLGTF